MPIYVIETPRGRGTISTRMLSAGKWLGQSGSVQVVLSTEGQAYLMTLLMRLQQFPAFERGVRVLLGSEDSTE